MFQILPFNLTVIAFLFGIVITIWLPDIPNLTNLLLGILLFITMAICKPNRCTILICIVSTGFTWMVFNIHQHLQHTIPEPLENQKIIINGTITSLVENSSGRASFDFKVKHLLSNKDNWLLPATVRINWQNAPKISPGDNWCLLVKIKRVRNYSNLGSFDLQKFYLQQRIVGLGYVVVDKQNKLLGRNFWANPINNIRQIILSNLQRDLKEQSFIGVIISFVLGVKHNISGAQMQIMQRTGIAHLMAISGLHMGLLATMSFTSITLLWRIVPRFFLKFAAPKIAAIAALVINIFYALLAGFSIATQRALIMLLIFLGGFIFKRNLATRHGFFIALALILVWDPFAILSLGFWFSFLAVAFLIYVNVGRAKSKDKFSIVVHWGKPYTILMLSLLPLNLLFFAQSPIITPIANAIAIPWVSFLVLPLSLIALIVLPISKTLAILLFKCAASVFGCLWPILEYLANFSVYSWQIPSQFLWLIIPLAILGAIWLLVPNGVSSRWWGLLNFAPLFFTNIPTIPYGQAEFTLLDVGQGLAAVIKTQHHVLVYDTGAKLSDHFDLGDRVVVPYLQARGIKYINTLIISHGDNDHIGGAQSVLKQIGADLVITSDLNDLPDYKPTICKALQEWDWDGVRFKILHPQEGVSNFKRNDHSCVLLVQANNHKVLLTGDIEAGSEQQLLATYPYELQVDILLVPHHGSKTSSSWEFLQQTSPKYALIPVGYKNRYGHPKPEIIARYEQIGARILNSRDHGAISFNLGSDLLVPHSYRLANRRFWLN